MRSPRLAAFALAITVSAGCDPANEVHVEPGSTAGALVLHAYRWPDSLDGLGTVTRLVVGRCAADGSLGAPVWAVERERRRWFGRPEPTRIAYGRPPSDRWRTVQAAGPLDSGCFYARAEGRAIDGQAIFRVLPGGRIEPVPDSMRYAEPIRDR